MLLIIGFNSNYIVAGKNKIYKFQNPEDRDRNKKTFSSKQIINTNIKTALEEAIYTSHTFDYISFVGNGMILDKILKEHKNIDKEIIKILINSFICTTFNFGKLMKILIKNYKEENFKQILLNLSDLNNANIKEEKLFEVLIEFFNYENSQFKKLIIKFQNEEFQQILKKLKNDIEDKELIDNLNYNFENKFTNLLTFNKNYHNLKTINSKKILIKNLHNETSIFLLKLINLINFEKEEIKMKDNLLEIYSFLHESPDMFKKN